MSPSPFSHSVRDEELRQLPRDGRKYELVAGEIRVSPAGGRHGEISLRLAARLLVYVDERGLGKVFDSSTGFRMANGNVRSPDVSFVSRERFPDGQAPVGFLEHGPDLAVEVLSPDDRAADLKDKLRDYFASGTRLVWAIDPASAAATLYRSPSAGEVTPSSGTLDGADVVPGFTCLLTTLLR